MGLGATSTPEEANELQEATMRSFLAALIALTPLTAFDASAQAQEQQPQAESPTVEQQPTGAPSGAQTQAAPTPMVAQKDILPPSPGAQQPTSPSTAPPAAQAPPSSLKVGNLSFDLYGFFLVTAHINEVGFGPAPFTTEEGETIEASGASTRLDFPNFANGLPGGFIMTVRQSRLGTRMELPTEIGTTLRGRLEFDLMGGFLNNSNAISWFTPLPRLRLAFVSGAWKLGEVGSIGFVAGQDFGLFAPLSAVSPALNGGPVFGSAGNAGGVRSPQFRVEGDFGADLKLAWGIGILTPPSNLENSTTPQLITADFGPGTRSGVPSFEGRLGLLYKRGKQSIVELAVSGHRDQEVYMLVDGRDARVVGEGVAADLQATLGIVGLRGEVFSGKNLDGVLGNWTNNGVRLVRDASATSSPSSVIPIRTRGAWGQAILKPIPLLQVFGGMGVENPDDEDLGESATTKRHNRQIHAGAIVTPTKVWTIGAEWMRTTTRYVGPLPRHPESDVLSGNHFAFSTALTF
jgi:hypothetical protein